MEDYYNSFINQVEEFFKLTIEQRLIALKSDKMDVDAAKEVILRDSRVVPTNIIAMYINKYFANQSEIRMFLEQLDLDPYRMSLLLDQIYVLNDRDDFKSSIINKKYPEFAGRSTDDIVYELQKNVYEAFEYLEDNDYLGYSYGELGNLFDEQTLNEMSNNASVIIENPNMDVGIRWFRSYSELVGTCMAYEHGYGNDFNVISSIDMWEETAEALTGANIILINAEKLPRTFNGNEFEGVSDIDKSSGYDVLTCLFHEFTHMEQRDYLVDENSKYDYKALCFAEQELIEAAFPELSNYYENYDRNPFEIDAREQGFIRTYRYLKSLDSVYTESYMNERIGNFKKDTFKSRLRDRQINGNDSFGEHLNKELILDNVPRDKIVKYLKKYPVLSCKYNPDGSKKSIDSILKYCQLAQNRLRSDQTGQAKRRYAFYLKVMRDYIEAYKEKRPLIMDSPKEVVEEYESRRGSK